MSTQKPRAQSKTRTSDGEFLVEEESLPAGRQGKTQDMKKSYYKNNPRAKKRPRALGTGKQGCFVAERMSSAHPESPLAFSSPRVRSGYSKSIYNKLVRDRIPEIIAADSEKPVTHILGDEEFKQELLKKLVEEAKETEGTKGKRKELAKELGDVLEVIEAVIQAFGLDRAEIEKIKQERKERRGGFARRIFLEYTE